MHPWRSRRARRRSRISGYGHLDTFVVVVVVVVVGICEDAGLYKFISVPMVGGFFFG